SSPRWSNPSRINTCGRTPRFAGFWPQALLATQAESTLTEVYENKRLYCSLKSTLTQKWGVGGALQPALAPGSYLKTRICRNSCRCRRSTTRGLRPVNLIHHEIHDHARHAHVEPQRQSPPCNHAMLIELFQPRAAQRHQNHGHNHHRKNRVRNQNREINRANPTLPCKRHMSHAVVINQIGKEKYRGDTKRRNHEPLMNGHLARTNSSVTAHKQHRACPIQNRIDRRLRDQRATLSYIMSPSSSGMCSTVAC